jgi:hypothetical protein
MIARESERCRKYAMPYIFNNSASVLGTEFMGDVGALRYNFVGIGGEQSQLRWLRHHFENWPLEKLEPLFDKIFLQILQPWYGQSVQQAITRSSITIPPGRSSLIWPRRQRRSCAPRPTNPRSSFLSSGDGS